MFTYDKIHILVISTLSEYKDFLHNKNVQFRNHLKILAGAP